MIRSISDCSPRIGHPNSRHDETGPYRAAWRYFATMLGA
jgi:hypothetical protein